MISSGRTEQLDIFCRVTGFTSDFLSFTDVELIRFFHGSLQLLRLPTVFSVPERPQECGNRAAVNCTNVGSRQASSASLHKFTSPTSRRPSSSRRSWSPLRLWPISARRRHASRGFGPCRYEAAWKTAPQVTAYALHNSKTAVTSHSQSTLSVLTAIFQVNLD